MACSLLCMHAGQLCTLSLLQKVDETSLFAITGKLRDPGHCSGFDGAPVNPLYQVLPSTANPVSDDIWDCDCYFISHSGAHINFCLLTFKDAVDYAVKKRQQVLFNPLHLISVVFVACLYTALPCFTSVVCSYHVDLTLFCDLMGAPLLHRRLSQLPSDSTGQHSFA